MSRSVTAGKLIRGAPIVLTLFVVLLGPSIARAVTCPAACPTDREVFAPEDFHSVTPPVLLCGPGSSNDDTTCWQCALDCAKYGNKFGAVVAKKGVYVIKDTLKVSNVYGGIINGNGGLLSWQPPSSLPTAPMFELADTQGMKFENLRIDVAPDKYLYTAFEVYDTTASPASRNLRLDHVVVDGIVNGRLDYGIRFVGDVTPNTACQPTDKCDQNNDTSSIIDSTFNNISKSAVYIGHSQSHHHRLQDVHGSAAVGATDTKFVELVDGDFDSEGGFRKGFEDIFYVATARHSVNIISPTSEGCQHLVRTLDTYQTRAYPIYVIGGRFAVDDIVDDTPGNWPPVNRGYSYVVHHSARGPMVVSGLTFTGTPGGTQTPNGLKPVIHFSNLPNDDAAYLQVSGVHSEVPSSADWDLIHGDHSDDAPGTGRGRVFAFANLCTDSLSGGAACKGYGGGMLSTSGLLFNDLALMDVAAGHVTWCTDCGANPASRLCTSPGPGAWAKRVGESWLCEGAEVTLEGSQVLKGKNLTDSSNTFAPTVPSDLDTTNAASTNQCLTKAATDQFTWANCGGAGSNTFSTMDAPSGTDPVADSTADTLGFVKGRSVDVVGNMTSDTLTISADSELYTDTMSAYLKSPANGDDGIIQFTFPTAVVITRVWCSTKTGTATISLDERTEAAPNTTNNWVVVNSVACDSDSQVATLSADTSIALHNPLNVDVVTVSGNPSAVRIHVEFTKND